MDLFTILIIEHIWIFQYSVMSWAYELCSKDKCYALDQSNTHLHSMELMQIHHCFGLLYLKVLSNVGDGGLKVKDLAQCEFEYETPDERLKVIPMKEDYQFCSYGKNEPTCSTSSRKMGPKPLPPLPDQIPFKSQSAAEVSFGVLMCGGLEADTPDPTLCHLFNKTSWAWQAFPSLLVGGGRGLIFEGSEKIALIGSRITPEGGTNAIQIFDGSKWTLGPDMPHKSWGLHNVRLNESHHLIVGGYAVGVWFLDDVLIFDMESLTIQPIEPYPQRTLIFGALKYSHQGKDYVLCFGDQSDPLDKFMYQLDLDSFTWSKFIGETPVTIVSARSMMIGPNTIWIGGVLSSKWNAGPYSYQLTLKNGKAIWNEMPPVASSQVMLGTLEREVIE